MKKQDDKEIGAKLRKIDREKNLIVKGLDEGKDNLEKMTELLEALAGTVRKNEEERKIKVRILRMSRL